MVYRDFVIVFGLRLLALLCHFAVIVVIGGGVSGGVSDGSVSICANLRDFYTHTHTHKN